MKKPKITHDDFRATFLGLMLTEIADKLHFCLTWIDRPEFVRALRRQLDAASVKLRKAEEALLPTYEWMSIEDALRKTENIYLLAFPLWNEMIDEASFIDALPVPAEKKKQRLKNEYSIMDYSGQIAPIQIDTPYLISYTVGRIYGRVMVFIDKTARDLYYKTAMQKAKGIIPNG